MSTKITPEALIEMGFKLICENRYRISLTIVDIEFETILGKVYAGRYRTNATTIEDIKDLIRLFK
jgi:hypothetical protein